MTDAVEIRGLTVAYRETPVLWNVDLTVPRGTMTAVLGPNGAGKTTLLKSMLGLTIPLAGSVRFHGAAFGKGGRHIAYVPQRGTVDWDFPTTVLDVVTMGTYGRLGWFRRPGRMEFDDARKALAEVGLADLAARQIGELSGGQQQRTFLARALVQHAELLVLDEPFQGVDAVTETAIVDVLRRQRTAGRTVIAVHHDLSTTADYFDRVVLLNVRKIADGPTADAFTPANIAAAYRAVAPRDFPVSASVR